MQLEKKYFSGPDGGGNFDDAAFALGPDQWVNMENCRTGTTDAGVIGTVESIGSTTLIPNPYITVGDNLQIGSATDEPGNRIVFFNWNSNGNHGIYCYDLNAGVIYIVLLASQVGYYTQISSDQQIFVSTLNFDKFHLIHSARIINGNIYWTDGLNEPRRMDIDAGIKMNHPSYVTSVVAYVAPLTESVIAWIRRQPGLPPTQTKILVTPQPATNFVDKDAFQFCYFYQYKGYELSTLSGLSNTAPFNEQDPPPTQTSLGVQNNSLIARNFNGSDYLASNYILPTNPTPAYGPGVMAKITRVGTGGANAPSTDIPIPLDWTGHPTTRGYTRVIVEGINAYFHSLPGNGSSGQLTAGPKPESPARTGKWYIEYRDGVNPTLNIIETWDWGIGDTAFPPTVQASLSLYTSTTVPSRKFSHIDVQIPVSEKIDQDVIVVNLVANYLVSSVYFIIKTWQKSIAADAQAIVNHNAGITPLTYSFFNDKAGIALDSAYSVKPFDSVPQLSETIEMAKYRSYMANYVLGYNSSNLITSLALSYKLSTVTPGSTSGTVITGEWYQARIVSEVPFGQIYQVYIMELTTPVIPMPYAPVYYYTTSGATPPFPQTINTGLIFIGTTYADITAYYGNLYNDSTPLIVGSLVDQHVSSALLSSNQSIDFGVLTKAFKANSPYQISISFRDNYGREWGIITNDSLLFSTSNTAFSTNQFVEFISWSLSNVNALTEIPIEAYYYSINITKCLRTRFFVESIGFVIYVTKDVSGVYQFTQLNYSANFVGVGINLTFLNSNGMGYVYSEGDVVDFFLNGSSYSLSIIGQQGLYIIAQLTDVGQLSGSSLCQFEIYTPYKKQTNEPFYEVAQIFPVSNPGTTTRGYSVLAGQISGDVFVFSRQNSYINYVAEAMSPNDIFYKLWFTDAGRPDFIDDIGQVSKKDSIAFSNTLILGSKNNGLSTYEALNTKDVYAECGPIRKLQLTSKVANEQGSVMLAVCEDEVASLYLGETQLLSAVSNAFVAQSTDVIGTVNVLKGSFGTVNPEGVCEFRGNVFIPDAKNGKVVQYSPNGLFPISQYKMTRFWKLFFDQYLSMTQSEVAALGSQPFIFMAVDPHNWELLVSIPRVLLYPPKGWLPDYPSTIYPFDIYDGQAKTIVFKLSVEPNHWTGAYRHTPEGMTVIQNKVFGFKFGYLYQHNSIEDYSINIYGIIYKARIMFVSNQMPNKPKVYENISVEGNLKPSLTYFRTEPSLANYDQFDLQEQASDLLDFQFEVKEGQLYSVIYRNKIVPNAEGVTFDGLLTAEKIRALALKILMEFEPTTQPLELRYVTLGYQASKGHTT